MNKLTTLIVDDELDGISTLKNFLKKYCPSVQVIGEAFSIKEAQEKIKLLSPTLVFLDINMPGGNGFDLLKRMEGYFFYTVFITAHDEYAIQAFKHNAVNYLLKPVNIDELIESVERVEKLVEASAPDTNLNQLLQNITTPLPNKLALPLLNGLVYVDIDAIIRCEAESNYTVFYFTNRPKVVVCKTLGNYEKLLAARGFFRVHHHHLINLAHLEYYQRGRGGLVTMSDKKEIAVSQRKKDEFLKLLEQSRR